MKLAIAIVLALSVVPGVVQAFTRPLFLPSLESQARAQTGLTNPLLPAVPEPARRNLADASFLSDNVALLGWLPGHKARLAPVDLRAQKSGRLFAPRIGAQDFGSEDAASLSTGLTGSEDELQRMQASAGLSYLRQEVGFSIFFDEAREAIRFADGSLAYTRYRDLKTQLGVGVPMFDRPDIGRLDFGVLVKLVFRRGDEIALSPEQVAADNPSVKDADTAKQSTAGGVDFGFLHTLAWRPGGWRFQTGYAWHDIGTTQFFLGPKTSRDTRFAAYPNSHNLGIGAGSPLYLRLFRTALRLEGLDLNADFPVARKLAASAELRFIDVASLLIGVRGPAPSFGVQFRLPYVEILVANAPIYSGAGSSFRAFRGWNFAMKGVF